MASQYDSIKTAEELLKEVAAHGLSTKPEDICRAQDIFGRSEVKELMLRRSSWSRGRSAKVAQMSLPASSRSESRCKTRIERFQPRTAILSSLRDAPEDVEPCSTL